jgi:adhesin transport system outer membrane protein
MHFETRFLLVVACLLWLPQVHAQERMWGYATLVQQAVQSHPVIKAKQAQRNAAGQDLEAATWQWFPTPSVEATSQSGGTGVLRLDQPLWTGGRISANIESAKSRVRISELAVQETGRDVVLKTIAAYSEALRQQRRKAHALQAVQAHESLLALMDRRVAQEINPLADRNLAYSRLLSAKNDLSTSQQALEVALTQLTELAGQTVREVGEQQLPAAPTPGSTREDALDAAMKVSPTLKRLAEEETLAEADVRAKESAYFPQLSLRLEHSAASQSTDNRAMLVLLAQPGAGLSAQSGVRAALARRDEARLNRDGALRDLRERVSQDWQDWQATRARVENSKLAQDLAHEVTESYARQFVAGRKTWIDVLNAQREATQAQWSLDDASAQLLAAQLRLALWTDAAAYATLNPPTTEPQRNEKTD